jgi:hypothetical protein
MPNSIQIKDKKMDHNKNLTVGLTVNLILKNIYH